MTEYYFCLSCNTASPETEFTLYEEKDVNWSELRCPKCDRSDYEEINWAWALEQTRAALALARQSYTTSKAHVARLEYAIDFFEGEEP